MSEERREWQDHEVEAALRKFDAEDNGLLEPPLSVWEGIRAAVHAGEQGPSADRDSSVRRRRTPRVVLAVAAAVAVLAGIALTLATLGGDESDQVIATSSTSSTSPPSTTTLGGDESDQVIATAVLGHDPRSFDPLGAQAEGRAQLVEHGSGHTIEITDAALVQPGADADLEVWLIQPDAQGGITDLVSIGLIDPDDPGALEVPSGYDPLVYNIVDVSIEPRDGDPGHSGRSILRGPLQQT